MRVEGAGRVLQCVFGAATGEECAWSDPEPTAGFKAIRQCLAFNQERIECYVDGEEVQAQQGGFYGGWITREIAGPFKGESGTAG